MLSLATQADLAEILNIYNEVIRNSTAVYQEVELTTERGEAWFAAKLAGGFPFLVARDASGVTGFGSFVSFARGRAIATALSIAFMSAPTAAAKASAELLWLNSWAGRRRCRNT